jgi:hypothetical protein
MWEFKEKISKNEANFIVFCLQSCVFYFYFRVLNLELKKEAVAKAVGSRNSGDTGAAADVEMSSADEAEFDEYLDWRAKKSYK